MPSYSHRTQQTILLHSIISIFLLIGATASFANSDEPRSGELELLTSNAESRQKRFGLQLGSKATIQINGMIATVDVEQTFQNPSAEWVEGRYVFPLPENAAVNAMEIHIGERLIKATIKEKQEAKKIYSQAKAAGKKAGLLEQHRPNLFSQKVANIAPKETIKVKLRYIQHVDYKDQRFSLRFPMTITPRYIPGSSNKNLQDSVADNSDPSGEAIVAIEQPVHIDSQQSWGWAQATKQVADANLITPPMLENSGTETHIINPIELDIKLDAGLPLASIDSAYHAISISKTNAQHTIHLSKGKVSMDRDFVLSWQPIASAAPTAALFNETINGDDYSLIMLMPPQSINNTEQAAKYSIKKESIFIIDTSGSMGGTSIKQAKAGLTYALKQLNSQDKFNIIEFNSNFSTLYKQPLAANTQNIKQALKFVSRLQAGGGTEMLPALNAALQQTHSESYLKQIVFITDGSVGNEAALFHRIHTDLGKARLFTVGIGSAPNSFFMRKAAEFGRGSFTYIGDVNEVDKKMRSLFSKINNPSMHDITIEDAQGRPLELFPNPIPDLYHGEPVIAAIRKDYESDTLIIKGTHNQQAWQQNLTFNHGSNHSGVANLWARKKIETLLDKERSEGKTDAIKEKIINVALEHKLMSPYTSFVAVEETISRPKSETLSKQAVPNLLAQGQQLQTVNYPQTATPLWFNLLSGLLALLCATALKLYKKTSTRAKQAHA